jgi:hypothetical protein
MSAPVFTSKLIKDVDMRKLDELRQRLVGERRVNVGVPRGVGNEENGTAVAMVAAVHEYGSPKQGIPERPFLRVSIQRNREKYVRLNRINLVRVVRGELTVEEALGQLGAMAAGDVQETIRAGNFAPLKPATVKRKGSSAPLIDSGQLIQSIQWELGGNSD